MIMLRLGELNNFKQSSKHYAMKPKPCQAPLGCNPTSCSLNKVSMASLLPATVCPFVSLSIHALWRIGGVPGGYVGD